MNKKYRIKSKVRFTIFLALVIIIAFTVATTILGLNTASSSSMNVYDQVEIHTGDTLWEIACEYCPDDMDVRAYVYDICDINNTSADQLEAGQKILVPIY